jgi:hypothetical protein
LPQLSAHPLGGAKKEMKSSELYYLLKSPDSGITLKSAIQDAMPGYRRGLAEGGRLAPIQVQSDGISHDISKEHIVNLCKIYLAGHIDEAEFEYVANCLELSEDFQYNDFISDILFRLSSPEINGALSPDEVRNILANMTSAA